MINGSKRPKLPGYDRLIVSPYVSTHNSLHFRSSPVRYHMSPSRVEAQRRKDYENLADRLPVRMHMTSLFQGFSLWGLSVSFGGLRWVCTKLAVTNGHRRAAYVIVC